MKINFNVYLIIIGLFSNFIYSQQTHLLDKNIVKLNILYPGLSFEQRVSDKSTFSISSNLILGFVASSDNLNFIASPTIKSQYRFYYNLEKRIAKGKKTVGNSASYFAFDSTYDFKPLNDDRFLSGSDGLNLGAVWGFQKTYKSNLNLGANVGLAYNLNGFQNTHVLPIINFSVGWVLFK